MKLEFTPEQDALATMVATIASDAREKGWFARSAGQIQDGSGDIVAQLAKADTLRLGLADPVGAGGGWAERVIVAEQLGRAGYRGRYFDAQAAVLAFSGLQEMTDEVRAASDGTRFLVTPGLHQGSFAGQVGNERVRVTGVDGAPHATHVMWLRLAEGEPQLALLPADSCGAISTQKSVDGDAIGEIDLPGTADAPPLLVGERAISAWADLRTGTGLLRAAEMTGACDTLIERTVEHAIDRIVFGRPIAAFQAAQHALAKADILRRSARLLVYRAASQLESGRPARRRSAAMALLIACDAAMECARVASQINGGTGFIIEHWLPDYFARVKAVDLRTGGRPARLVHVRENIVATRRDGLNMRNFWEWGL